MLDHPLGELLASVVGNVILQEPAQEIAAAADREADREGELVTEGAVVHEAAMFLLCSRGRGAEAVGRVKGPHRTSPFNDKDAHMAKINIYIPDELKAPMDAAGFIDGATEVWQEVADKV